MSCVGPAALPMKETRHFSGFPAHLLGKGTWPCLQYTFRDGNPWILRGWVAQPPCLPSLNLRFGEHSTFGVVLLWFAAVSLRLCTRSFHHIPWFNLFCLESTIIRGCESGLTLATFGNSCKQHPRHQIALRIAGVQTSGVLHSTYSISNPKQLTEWQGQSRLVGHERGGDLPPSARTTHWSGSWRPPFAECGKRAPNGGRNTSWLHPNVQYYSTLTITYQKHSLDNDLFSASQ